MDSNALHFVIGAAAIVVILMLIARRWIDSPSRQIDRYLAQIKAGETPEVLKRTRWDHEVSCDAQGFTIAPLVDASQAPLSLEWASIVEAIAFKRDLISTDRVCIAFRAAYGYEVEVHEEMKGWVELCDALPRYLPGAPAWTDWFMKITTPAFELNPTLLFRRDGAD